MFSLADHLHSGQRTLEPWTALTWVAAATERIEVMTNVLALPYRPPAVTAKMAETLDRLSGGRLVLGLGGGGYDAEFSAFGLAERTPGQKTTALGEAVQIIRGLWNEQTTSFTGEQFQARDARIEPKPSHPIPIWLGTYGHRGLKLTGALADGWIPSLGRLDFDQARAMRAAVRAGAEAAGRDPDAITCATNVGNVVVDPSHSPTLQLAAGTPAALAEHLIAIVHTGFTVLNVAFPAPEHREQFAADVIPLVRAELDRD